jgi:hypothetical protein
MKLVGVSKEFRNVLKPFLELQEKCNPVKMFPELEIRGKISEGCLEIIKECIKDKYGLITHFKSEDWRYLHILPIDTLIISDGFKDSNDITAYFENLNPVKLSRIELLSVENSIVLDAVFSRNILERIKEFKIVNMDRKFKAWSKIPESIAILTARIINTARNLEKLEYDVSHSFGLQQAPVLDALKKSGIKKLDLGFSQLFPLPMEELLERMENLEELRGDQIILESFEHAKSLKKLSILISAFHSTIWELRRIMWNLRDMTQLEYLEITLPNIDSRTSMYFGEEKLLFPHLRELKFYDNRGILGSIFHQESLLNLESLSVKYHSNLETLYSQKSLKMKTLVITGLDLDISKDFQDKFLKRFPNLEYLHLEGNVPTLFLEDFPELNMLILKTKGAIDFKDLEKSNINTLIFNGLEYHRSLSSGKFFQYL